MENRYLEETKILNYQSHEIQNLIVQRGWKDKDDYHKIKAIYDFVRNEILFGYNISDTIPATRVLKDGMGQCNTKANLLMALLRAVDIPCRLHAFTVSNRVQKGATSGIVERHMPSEVMHTWVEVFFENSWYVLEGVIIDQKYLEGIHAKFSNPTGAFCGYGICIHDVANPPIQWDRCDTFIQKDAICQDFGLYDSPDQLAIEHSQPLSAVKKGLYQYFGRHYMNRNVKHIRNVR